MSPWGWTTYLLLLVMAALWGLIIYEMMISRLGISTLYAFPISFGVGYLLGRIALRWMR